jgi:3-dehydroquinate dehydratase-2
MRVLVLHGPNLNLLGQREPEIYGERTLDEVREAMGVVARELDVDLVDEVSQGEATLVDLIQGASAQGFAGAVINAGAFTHTSVALRDALRGSGLRFVEVHLSNPLARESFRHHSLLSDLAIGVVSGLGVHSYVLGLRGLVSVLRAQ